MLHVEHEIPIDTWDLMKLKFSSTIKKTVSHVKKQPIENGRWEKIVIGYNSMRGSISRQYKETGE